MLHNFLDFVSLGKVVRKIKHSSLAGWHKDERAGLGGEKARLQIILLPRRPAEGSYVLGIQPTWLAGRQWVKEVGIYILFYLSQKMNNQVRLLIFVVPAAGMVHPICRLGALE